ncbi:MAG: hypothetical protein JNK37_05810 [Verrucomicrobiales bacterium]|nr:hypothetical protein [Verrucomicrobiales bacterium]
MDKSQVINALRTELESQFRRVTGAADEARGYATDPDSKAENKYDTRTVEASYLAAGQAAKAEELAATLQTFATWTPPGFAPDAAIALGALVETAGEDGHRAAFLLAPVGGGLDTEVDGIVTTVVSPQASLFQRLQGARVGDQVGALRIVALS